VVVTSADLSCEGAGEALVDGDACPLDLPPDDDDGDGVCDADDVCAGPDGVDTDLDGTPERL
jgi:hypothetical protein